MKILFLSIIFVFTSFVVNAQDWFRFDYTFQLIEATNKNEILTPKKIEEKKYKLYVFTSSNSSIQKFYFDESLNKFRIVSEIMKDSKDPYLVIVREDSLMGVLLMPEEMQKWENSTIKIDEFLYEPGLYKIEKCINSGKYIDIYFRDDKNRTKMQSAVKNKPKISADKELLYKDLDKFYDYAYSYTGVKQSKPESEKVYKLDIW